METGVVQQSPIASVLLSLPQAANVNGYLPRIGQELNISDYQSLYNTIGGAFNYPLWYQASATSIVQMTSNSLPAGYTAQTITGTPYSGYTAKEFQVFDRSVATLMYYSAQYFCIELAHPATYISKIGLQADSTYNLAQPSSGKIMQSVDGTNFIQTATFENLSYAASEEKLITPSILKAVKTRLYSFCSNNGNGMLGNLNLYPYGDLSQFSIPDDPFVTGDEVYIYSATNNKPSELQTQSTYFARRISAGIYQLHPTSADATNNTNKVTPTTTGDALTIYKKNKFRLNDTRAGNYADFIKY